MKRLLIALMALSLVLVAVSFASAQINMNTLEEILYVEAVQNALASFEASIPGIQIILEPYKTLSEPYQTYNSGDDRKGDKCDRDRHERERYGRCDRDRHERERYGRCDRDRHERERYHRRCERDRHV